ncbi:hypothetical protein IC762_17710 [Bradyrhizobium genosp. L]|uniref:hypothetical protein n=1 Tax=Bradyrhizobium genosp. L TaxID=83637 RepID=UPI0018A2B6FE|nr:hypothetical protein [Bradyrhizobium genosp. L]QPF81662.1 hypothetical protein IC762_17710 [Bradyrhizobium genosp. L]
MRRLIIGAALLALAAGSAHAQSAPTDKMTIEVTRAELQIIGQGLMELPYKSVAQLMIKLQAQIDAAEKTKPVDPAPAIVPKAYPDAKPN